jgi:glycosyltransferase involved in cell wall biosynthesis
MRSSRAAGVEVTGRVNDPSSYLAQAAVVAVPLRQGGGMRVKVIEALAAGKAVVASRLAVEGLDVHHGVDIWLAESDEDFITAISTLLRCPRQRHALGVAARDWASRSQAPAPWMAQYEAMYTRLGIA